MFLLFFSPPRAQVSRGARVGQKGEERGGRSPNREDVEQKEGRREERREGGRGHERGEGRERIFEGGRREDRDGYPDLPPGSQYGTLGNELRYKYCIFHGRRNFLEDLYPGNKNQKIKNSTP
jgi:hypothetical protein